MRATTSPVRYPFLDWPGPLAFAHRGGAIDAPENTMEAFANAIALGYRYVETDVHATRDGVIVAFHDDDLQRVSTLSGRIASLPWTDVQRATVGDNGTIPQLEDLLGTWPDVRVNIDCKSDGAVDGLIAAIRRTNSIDRVCLASFNERRIRHLRAALGPQLCSALSMRGVAALRAGLPSTAAACAQVPVTHGRLTVVDQRFLARAARRGIAVHVWTVDDENEMSRLLDLGVGGLMTDRPATLKSVLEARGQWHS